MNKHLNLSLVIVFGLFVNGHSPTKNVKTDLIQKKLNGKVKSFYDSICSIGGRQDSVFNIHEYFFNKRGFITQSHYLSEGVKKNTNEYKYNKEGNLIEVVSLNHYLNITNTFAWNQIYRYDEKGHNIEQINYNKENKLCLHEFYKYDFSGNRIEEFKLDPYYEPFDSNKIINKYDLSRNLIEKQWYNKKGILEVKYFYIFDKMGNQIEEKSINGKGQVTHHWIGKYDDKHNCIEKIYYTGDRIKYIDNYFYDGFDKEGNWTKSICYTTEFAEDDFDQHPYGLKLKIKTIFNIRKIEYY